MNILKHKLCGNELTVGQLVDDVAIYVYCDKCRDIVEGDEILGVTEKDLEKGNIRLIKNEH